MLDRVLNKKVRVGVAFNAVEFGLHALTTKTGQYEGIVVEFGTFVGEETFLMLDNGIIINLKYIQTIEIVD